MIGGVIRHMSLVNAPDEILLCMGEDLSPRMGYFYMYDNSNQSFRIGNLGLELPDIDHFLNGMTGVLDGGAYEFEDRFGDHLRVNGNSEYMMIVFTEWLRPVIRIRIPTAKYLTFIHNAWTLNTPNGKFRASSDGAIPLVKI